MKKTACVEFDRLSRVHLLAGCGRRDHQRDRCQSAGVGASVHGAEHGQGERGGRVGGGPRQSVQLAGVGGDSAGGVRAEIPEKLGVLHDAGRGVSARAGAEASVRRRCVRRPFDSAGGGGAAVQGLAGRQTCGDSGEMEALSRGPIAASSAAALRALEQRRSEQLDDPWLAPAVHSRQEGVGSELHCEFPVGGHSGVHRYDRTRIRLRQLYKLNCIGRVRAWAAPLVSLLHVSSGEGEENLAKQRSHRSARQAFYELVCNGSVENGISNLLALPEAALPTCWALTQDIIWTSHLQGSHVEGIVQALLSLLDKGKGSSEHVQEVAARALANISAALHRTTEVAFPGNLNSLVSLVSKDIADSVKENVVRALGNLVAAEQTKLDASPKVLEALVAATGSRVSPNVQKEAARSLGLLACDAQNRVAIAKFPGVLDQLAGLLRRDVSPVVRSEVIQSMRRLADSGESKSGVGAGAIVAQDGLSKLLLDVNPALQRMAKRVLLAEDSAVQDDPPTSVEAFIISCYDKIKQRLYEEALVDLEAAERLMMVINKTSTAKEQMGVVGLRQLRFKRTTLTNLNALTLSQLKVFVKAMLRDYHGALSDLDMVISLMPARSFYWQERGVLKRLMGDLPGALDDLNTRVARNPLSYDSFKHRAYVKFLLEDINGASADAEMATKVAFSCQSTNQAQTPSSISPLVHVVDCLGMLPVQFLDYNLN
ncbi:hypothetical protein Mapa_013929 [Marchantia paleacea]|nr:hypothetical protein Mapa_013929 [Marchantia paleacea]